MITARNDDIVSFDEILGLVCRPASCGFPPFKNELFVLHDFQKVRHVSHFDKGFELINVNNRRRSMGSQVCPLVGRRLKAPRLVRIVPESPFHVSGIRF